MKKIIVLLCFFLMSYTAQASVQETGKVTRVIVESGDILSVWLSGPDQASECSGGGRWTILGSDSLFKEKLSLILTAASQGKDVKLYRVDGPCGPWDSNSAYYVDVSF